MAERIPNTEADKRPIDGPCPQLARAVRQVLRWGAPDAMGPRDAARRTGVSHATISDMARGMRVKIDTLQRFAEGMGEDPEPLLRAAGYLSSNADAVLAELRKYLRHLCAERGDNDWPDDASPIDVIEGHLLPHIDAEIKRAADSHDQQTRTKIAAEEMHKIMRNQNKDAEPPSNA